jgi:hypothetical protein
MLCHCELAKNTRDQGSTDASACEQLIRIMVFHPFAFASF